LSGGVGVNFGWTFTTPVCQIYNDSDVSTEEVNIKFDMKCNETNTTEITRPGCFVEIVAGEHYESEEHFIAEFRIPYYQRFWPWDPEYSWPTTSLTIHPCLT
jgi:hypothetical protein